MYSVVGQGSYRPERKKKPSPTQRQITSQKPSQTQKPTAGKKQSQGPKPPQTNQRQPGTGNLRSPDLGTNIPICPSSTAPIGVTTPSDGSSQHSRTDNDQNGPHRSRRHSYKEKSFLQRIFCLLRRLYGAQEEEDDPDLCDIHVTRYRPEELWKLTSTTKFTRKEIQIMYRGFKQECPTGLVDEASFKTIFAQFFPEGDASQYAHFVFNTMQHNSEGQITFEDFLNALSTVSRGTIQEKLQWIFGLYDVNHDGLITKMEMMDVVAAIYAMVGPNNHREVGDNAAKAHVDKIFDLIDKNKDGAITIEELAEWVAKDENVIQSLSMMDTVLYSQKDNRHPSPPSRPSLSSP